MTDMTDMTDPLEASFEAAELEVLRAEMADLRGRVDQAVVAAGRPALAGVKAAGDVAAKAFVDGYLRQGSDLGLERKSLNAATDPAGGYAVPESIDAIIDRTLKAVSPIRAIANVVKVGSAAYRKLVTTGGTVSGWAAETAGRPETGTASFVEIVPPMGDLYANPSASQAMLDDAAFDVEEWLAGEIAAEFARAEGAAFVNGDGAAKPKGFLSYAAATTGDATRPFGTLQYLATGVAGGFPASNPSDKLIDFVQTLRPPYRQGACFVMNSATLATIRKFKTADGGFLWQPSLHDGRPDTLLGYPVVEAEDMPDMSANGYAVAFGNFRAGYIVTERAETQILRDPFTNKPFVNFYATKRMGGAVANSEAIKLLKFAAA